MSVPSGSVSGCSDAAFRSPSTLSRSVATTGLIAMSHSVSSSFDDVKVVSSSGGTAWRTATLEPNKTLRQLLSEGGRISLFRPCCEIATYLRNNCIASSAKTPPVIVIGTNGAFAAISALEIMI